MSHELTMREGGVAEMAYVGKEPWHNLGQRLQAGATLEEWCKAAGMEWTVVRSPVRFQAENSTPTRYVRLKGRDVLFRSDTKAGLSVVSTEYKIVQPRDILSYFDELASRAGFALETAGTLFGGKQFWGLATTEHSEAVLDPADRMRSRLLLSTSVDGTLATTAKFLNERVVCHNTLTAGLAERGATQVKISHRTTFSPERLNEGLGIKVKEQFQEEMEVFRKLASSPMSPEQMVRLTMDLYVPDLPMDVSAKDLERVMRKRPLAKIANLALGSDLIGSELAGGTGTAWAWLNAVTQYIDHDNGSRTDDRRIKRAWFGKGSAYKQRAFAMAVSQTQSTQTHEPLVISDEDLVAMLPKVVAEVLPEEDETEAEC